MRMRSMATLVTLILAADIARAQDVPGRSSFPGSDPLLDPGTETLKLNQDPKPGAAQPWLADRGEGIHTSMFGTYVREHELLVYVFYEYTVNRDEEYKPEELGFAGSTDYSGKRVDHEILLSMAYGLTADLMVEFESALWTRATLTKSSQDTSALPAHLSEQGLGDTEGQIRWRFLRETEGLPEALVFAECVLPLQRSKVLIGTQGFEFEAGIVVTKGFSWGTLSARISYAYRREEKKGEFGEYAIEYVKKLSDSWRVVLAVEGEQDEVSGIVEFQWKPWPNVTIKLNNAVGITSKAPDWAPEFGIQLSF